MYFSLDCYKWLEKVKMNGVWLIKFGKKEHLEQILDGKLRFCTLSYYRNYEEKENEKGTKDFSEGATEIVYPNTTKSEFEFYGLSRDEILGAKKLIFIPKNDKYISCFSYFTEKDINESKIISQDILENKNWEYVLLFKNPNNLLSKMKEVCEVDFCSGKVYYYKDEQEDKVCLDEFHKSEKFSYQKEFRFSFPVFPEYPRNIEKYDDNSCFVYFGKLDGYICKTADFQEKVIESFNKQRKAKKEKLLCK